MKVAILGFGIEGRSAYEYYLSKGCEITVLDENENPKQELPSGIEKVNGKGAFDDLNDFDIVIRTPSIRPDRIKTKAKIWSATNEFFSECPAEIIGVTGTKGKGTTCTLISMILKNSGKTVHLVGNIGVPALAELSKISSNDLVVYELSSFQLWDIEKSPHVAVWLMMDVDHLDIHKNMFEYTEAKSNITNYQSQDDILVHHPSNTYLQNYLGKTKAKKIPYLEPPGAYIQDGKIIISGNDICELEEVGLIGEHNLDNISAAITAVWQYTNDISAIRKAVTEFKGLEHRLEFVREIGGVSFYNDSQSTTPVSTKAAIQAVKGRKVIIIGGSDKGADYHDLIQSLDQETDKVILIGESSNVMETIFTELGMSNYLKLGSSSSMKEIVDQAFQISSGSGSVILSPACASFDMFKSYIDRGDQFKQAVNNLG